MSYNRKRSRKTAPENVTQTLPEKFGKIWDSNTLIYSFIDNFHVSFDDNRLFSLYEGKIIVTQEGSPLSKITEIGEDEDAVVSFILHPLDPNLIIACTAKCFIRVFTLDTGKLVKSIKLTKIFVNHFAIDNSHKFLACACSNYSVLIFDLSTWDLVSRYTGHTEIINHLAFSPVAHDFTLFTAGEDGVLKKYDILLKKESDLCTLQGYSLRIIRPTNDGKNLVVSTNDKRIIVFNLKQQKVLAEYRFPKDIKDVLYFARREQNNVRSFLLVADESGKITEVDLQTGKLESFFQPFNHSILLFNYSLASGVLKVVSEEQIYGKYQIDLSKSTIDKSRQISLTPTNCQEILAIKAINENEILFSSNDNSLKYMNIETNEVKIFESHSDFILSIDVLAPYVVTAGKDNLVKLWVYRWKPQFECKNVLTFKGHAETVNYCALVPNSSRVLSCSKDKSVKLWNFSKLVGDDLPNSLFDQESAKVIKKAEISVVEHSDEVLLTKASKNGDVIISAGFDKDILVYDAELNVKLRMTGHKRAVYDVNFSEYQKVVVSASSDRTVRIWNLKNGACLNVFEGHLAACLKADFIFLGTFLATSGADGLIKLWNIKTGENTATIEKHEGKIWAMEIDKLNNRIISGGTDGQLIVSRDVTAEREKEKFLEAEENIAEEERLYLLMGEGEFLEAMEVALDLNKKREFAKIVRNLFDLSSVSKDPVAEIIENRKEVDEKFDESEMTNLMDKIKIMADNQRMQSIIAKNFEKITEIARDQLTKPVSCIVGAVLIGLILLTTDLKELKGKAKDNIITTKAFLSKHNERVTRLATKASFLEYLVDRMTPGI